MSGHSRWSQIKRKKGKADVQRGKLFSKILREITVAARNGGGDPKANMRLKAATEMAREANMPQENIKRAIQKGTGELPGESYEEVTYEGYAPGGVAVLIYVLTDNRNRTGPEIRHVFEKQGGNLGSAGAVAWMFERKGVIHVDAEKISEDDLLAKALDAGATDMRRAEKVFEITTAPAEMDHVRDALLRAGVPVLEARVTHVPKSTVRVESKDAASVLRLIEALEELDDVQAVFANYDGGPCAVRARPGGPLCRVPVPAYRAAYGARPRRGLPRGAPARRDGAGPEPGGGQARRHGQRRRLEGAGAALGRPAPRARAASDALARGRRARPRADGAVEAGRADPVKRGVWNGAGAHLVSGHPPIAPGSRAPLQ